MKCFARSLGFGTGVLLAVGAATLCSVVRAEELPARTFMNNRSLIDGVGVADVPPLRRAAGPGAGVTMRALLKRFSAGQSQLALIGSVSESESAKGARANGPDGAWSIVVKGDGTAGRVQDYEYLASSPRVSPQDRMSSVQLEQLGRTFIGANLAEFVHLATDDELVALKTDYQVEAVGKGSTTLREEVVAGTIVFGRKVGGVDVVGAGSKIMVTFANDGRPVAFSFDWPVYQELGKRQRILPIDQIRERTSALATMRFASDLVEIRGFECGYFDPGARLSRRDKTAPVQAGCSVHYVGTKTATGSMAAIKDPVSDFIPVGETVEADQGWPSAIAQLVYGDVCQESVLSSAIVAPPAAP